MTAVKNGKTKITAEFTGHPAPEIHWFKNKKEIFSGKRQWIENIAGATSLTIGEMREDDEGMMLKLKYTFILCHTNVQKRVEIK